MLETMTFISYSRRDQEFAIDLATKLRMAGAKIWMDALDILPGQDWEREIEKALYACERFLLILSPSAVDSDEVRAELNLARQENKNVIPVLHQECKIPFRIKHIQYCDFTSNQDAGLRRLFAAFGLKFSSASSPTSSAADAKTSIRQAPSPTSSAPPWASHHGQDQYGRFADFTIAEITQRLRWIPPGEFLMGSPPEESGRLDRELQHRVQISSGYWLFDTQVTQALWQAVMGTNPSRFKSPMRPVESVSWDDCQDFIQHMNDHLSGLKCRLPTEAEWEYACRAGTTTPFNTGENLTTDQANYDGNYPYRNFPKGKYREETSPVGTFPSNAWGLYDMHGNVYEWCSDWYAKDYYETCRSQGVAVDPQGPKKGSSRVLRGGYWGSYAVNCRSASRNDYRPGYRGTYRGCRLLGVPQFS